MGSIPVISNGEATLLQTSTPPDSESSLPIQDTLRRFTLEDQPIDEERHLKVRITIALPFSDVLMVISRDRWQSLVQDFLGSPLEFSYLLKFLELI